MTSKRGKFGAALLVAIGLMAAAGWWLGDQDQPRQAVIAPMAEPAPATREIVRPLPEAAPAAPVKSMGAFAPPVPDALVPPPLAAPLLGRHEKRDSLTHSVTPDPAPSRPAELQPKAWERNAMASPANHAHMPLIAIVIDDLGITPERAAAALALPAAITMSVLPYARDAAAVARKARLLGHEVLVHLPMEAEHGQDPGPQALLAGLSGDAFTGRLHWSLARLEGYVGVNNHMGSGLTQNRAAMALLMAQLKQRGLLFLDSRTAKQTLAASTARAMGVTALERDVFLDNVITREAVGAQLRKAEEIARRNGYAVAIGHPHAATIEALTGWAADLEARGFRLAPLSAIARADRAGKRVVSLPLPGG